MPVFESEYSTSDTVSVSEYLNRIFMMSISNSILSDMVVIIRIRIQIQQKNIKTNIILVISVHIRFVFIY